MASHQERTYRRAAAVIVILSGAFSLLYSLIVPMWEGPDEIGHYLFVRELQSTTRLPEQGRGVLGESHQPPLYYALAALISLPADQESSIAALRLNPDFTWAGGDQPNIALHHTDETFPFEGQAMGMHLARLASVFMGMATLWFIISTAWKVFPDQPWIGLMAAVLVAFNPQYLFIHSYVNNDTLLITASTGIIWQTIRMDEGSHTLKSWLHLGIWISISLLTKLSAVSVAAVSIIYLSIREIRVKAYRQLARSLLAVGVVVLFLTGWWFVRNQIVYGDPLGWSVFNDVFSEVFRQSPITGADIRQFLIVQFKSLWATFGWITIAGPTWFHYLMLLLILSGTGGIVFSIFSGRWQQLKDFQRRAVVFLAAVVIVQQLFILWSITRFDETWYQGRYLLPAIAAIGIILAYGLELLISHLSHNFRLSLRSLLFVLMAYSALFVAFGVIEPAYESPFLPKSSVWFLPGRVDALFGGQIRLKGYRVDHDKEESTIDLLLYWQIERPDDLSNSVFVHLLDTEGKLADQDDGLPGVHDGAPPSSWLPGDILEDERSLTISPGAQALEIKVGLYNWITGDRLPVVVDGAGSGDSITIPLDLR